MKCENVAGVSLPTFDIRENDDPDAQVEKIGMYGGKHC